MCERVYNFFETIATSEICPRNIAVVAHSAMLLTAFNGVMYVDDEASRLWFKTAEMRSMVVELKKVSKVD